MLVLLKDVNFSLLFFQIGSFFRLAWWWIKFTRYKILEKFQFQLEWREKLSWIIISWKKKFWEQKKTIWIVNCGENLSWSLWRWMYSLDCRVNGLAIFHEQPENPLRRKCPKIDDWTFIMCFGYGSWKCKNCGFQLTVSVGGETINRVLLQLAVFLSHFSAGWTLLSNLRSLLCFFLLLSFSPSF